VKICGITRTQDALLAARLGADFIGLNFYPPSPRAVSLARAEGIVGALRALASPPQIVGVFVNQALDEIRALEQQLALDLLQLHGNEGPAEVRALGPRVIKALRVKERFDPAVARSFLAPAACAPGADPWGFLIDSKHPRLFGGSGQSWAFVSLAGVDLGRPLLIAGGLGPDTVAAAVDAARPWGVDVCSGVESEPGIKDPLLLARFFEEIRHAAKPVAS